MIFKLPVTILASIININYSYATNIISLGNSYVICNNIRHTPKSPKGMNNHQFSSISSTIVSNVNSRYISTLSSDSHTSSTNGNSDYYNLDDNISINNNTIYDNINASTNNTNNTNIDNVNDDNNSFQPKIVIAALLSTAFAILSFIGIICSRKKTSTNETLERVNSGKKRTHNQDIILNDSYEDSQGYLVPNYNKRVKYNEADTPNDGMYEQISENINDNNDEVDNTDYYNNNEILYNLADSINQQPKYANVI
jgi:hypothetical protein